MGRADVKRTLRAAHPGRYVSLQAPNLNRMREATIAGRPCLAQTVEYEKEDEPGVSWGGEAVASSAFPLPGDPAVSSSVPEGLRAELPIFDYEGPVQAEDGTIRHVRGQVVLTAYNTQLMSDRSVRYQVNFVGVGQPSEYNPK